MTTSDRSACGAAVRRRRRPARQLPGAALAAIYIGACLLPLMAALGTRVAPAHAWERTAAALGMIALAAMAAQFVTSGRFDLVSRHLGIDRTMAFHKVAARWVLLAAILHPFLYVLPTWLEDGALGRERFLAYITAPHYRSGGIALGALVLLLLTSVLRERLPWRYEIWRATHLPLGAAAVTAGAHHALAVGRFSAGPPVAAMWWAAVLGVAGVVAVLYGWRWLRLHIRLWRLASVRPVAERMWELEIRPGPGAPALDYRAGQFVWMSVGPRRFPLFDHPFSIADSPLQPGLRLIIKEAGDFTGRIGALAPGTPIGIDGPYGDFVLEAREADAVLLIAGGVGIAPVMGLLRDMIVRGETRPVRLIYAAGAPGKFACLDVVEAARNALDLKALLLSETPGEGWPGEVGRIDRDRLRGMLDGLDPGRSVALVCGPAGMVTAASDALLDLGMPLRNVVYERFDYTAGGASRQDRRRTRRFAAIGALLAAAAGGFALATG